VKRSGANVPGCVHQTANTIQAIRATLSKKALVLITLLLKACFTMRQLFLRRSSDRFDLDHAFFQIAIRPSPHETIRQTAIGQR
jgi:hypothetical protein